MIKRIAFITAAFLAFCAGSVLSSFAQVTAVNDPWKAVVGQSNVRVIPRPFNSVPEFRWSIGISRGASSEVVFDVPDMTGDFVGAYVWNDRRLTLLAGETAAVIDIPSRSVVDVFFVKEPRLSPDNRFIAFLQIVPRYLEDQGAIYKIYDVSASRSNNRYRPELDSDESLMNGGIVVYPEFERLTRRTKRAPDSVPHTVRSPLQWVSSSLLVFVDYSGNANEPSGRLALVSVDLRRSTKDPLVFEQPIDVRPLMSRKAQSGAQNPASELQASGIDIVGPLQNGYQLRVRLIRNSGAIVDFVDLDLRQ